MFGIELAFGDCKRQGRFIVLLWADRALHVYPRQPWISQFLPPLRPDGLVAFFL